MRKKIILIDLTSRDKTHHMFNFSMLYSLSERNEVEAWFNESYFLSTPRVIREKFQIKYFNEYLNPALGGMFSYLQFLYFFLKNRKGVKGAILFFSGYELTTFTLLSLLFSRAYKLNRNRVLIVAHNHLDIINKSRVKSWIYNMLLRRNGFDLVCLTKGAQSFSSTMQISGAYLLHHPIVETYYRDILGLEELGKLDFSKKKLKLFISERSFDNSTENYEKIFWNVLRDSEKFVLVCSSRFKDKYSDEIVESGVECDVYAFKCGYKTFMTILGKSDLLLFFYDPNYNRRASGLLMDAIALGVPCVVPNTGVFKEFFQDFGFGYLYKSSKDFRSEIYKAHSDISKGKSNFGEIRNNILQDRNGLKTEYNLMRIIRDLKKRLAFK